MRIENINSTNLIDVIERVKQLPEPNFIWKGIPEGSIGLLTGVAKTGKTTFAENLAISMALGRNSFFNFEMDGVPRKVLYMNLEEQESLWGRRQGKQINELSGVEIELLRMNYYTMPDGYVEFINDEKDWLKLHTYIKDVNPDVVLLDSLSHMCVGEIEKSKVAQDFIQDFRRYIRSLKKTVLVVHHNTKGNTTAVEMDKIAGSRFITQEFEYAFGFANVPYKDDESYLSMLYNKHVPGEKSTSYVYKFNDNGWVQNIGAVNKYDLYTKQDVDYRTVSDNKEKIYQYFLSTASQAGTTSQGVKTISVDAKSLAKEFVVSKIMAKDSLFRNLKVLTQEKIITRSSKGVYSFTPKSEDLDGGENQVSSMI